MIAWQQRVRKYLQSTPYLSKAVNALKEGADSTPFRDAVNSLALVSDDGDYVLASLERLYVEGELIEVSLDEISTLWAILNVARPPVRPPTPDEATEALMLTLQEQRQMQKEINPKKQGTKSKTTPNKSLSSLVPRKSTSPTIKPTTHGRASSGGVQLLLQSLAKASRKRRAEEASLAKKEADLAKKLGTKAASVKRESTVSLTAPKKQTKKASSSRKSHGDTKNRNASDTTDKEWSDDECSADKCVKPLGDDVNWVQCDKCQLWYHCECLGMGDKVFSEDEKFYCYRCDSTTPRIDTALKKEPVIENSKVNGSSRMDLVAEGQTVDGAVEEDLVIEQVVTDQDVTRADVDRHVATLANSQWQPVDEQRDVSDILASMASGSNTAAIANGAQQQPPASAPQ